MLANFDSVASLKARVLSLQKDKETSWWHFRLDPTSVAYVKISVVAVI